MRDPQNFFTYDDCDALAGQRDPKVCSGARTLTVEKANTLIREALGPKVDVQQRMGGVRIVRVDETQDVPTGEYHLFCVEEGK